MPLIKSQHVPMTTSPMSLADVHRQARAMTERAEAQAKQTLEQAVTDAAIAYEAARKQGFDEGKAAGLKEGHEQGLVVGREQSLKDYNAQLSKLVQALNAALGQVEVHRGMIESQGVADCIELAISIARRVVKIQGASGEVALANLADALRLVSHASDVRIALHPSQMKSIQDDLPGLRLEFPKLGHVEFTADASIDPGGCRIHTLGGFVDAQLSSQIDEIAAQLTGRSSSGRIGMAA